MSDEPAARNRGRLASFNPKFKEMNNYYVNQIRRADCGLVKKTIGLIAGLLCPRRLERSWRAHATEMQWALDHQPARTQLGGVPVFMDGLC